MILKLHFIVLKGIYKYNIIYFIIKNIEKNLIINLFILKIRFKTMKNYNTTTSTFNFDTINMKKPKKQR